MSPKLLIAGLAASMLLIASSTHAAKELYRWTDENGVVHYSDTKPKGTEFERRDVATDPVRAPVAKTDPASAAAAAPAAPKPKPEPSPECLQARSNLETLNTAESVSMDTDGDGVPETLDADARQRAVFSGYELMQKLCAE
jgi:hypothetical protein